MEAALGGPGSLFGARVLDLFAGTGALGIEALSRGALSAVFVERDEAALAALRSNLATLGLADRARVVPGTAARYLEQAAGERYTVVFLDPPFQGTDADDGLVQLARKRLVGTEGLAVVEHPAGQPPSAAGWDVRFERDYGSVGLTLLAPAAETQAEEGT